MRNKKSDCNAHNPELIDDIKNKIPSRIMLSSMADFYKIMGDYTRIRLLTVLEKSEMCVCDLSVLLNMTKSALSHQLRVLKDSRLVKSRKNGKHVFYSLDDEHIKTILDIAMNHLNEQ